MLLYDYKFRLDIFRNQEKSKLPHTLEQIAELKLLHLPKVLERGVDLIMLDLDVGFLSDPRRLLEGTKPKFDVFVQVCSSGIECTNLE